MRTRSIDQLNGFLRGELSAVETYRMAIDTLVADQLAQDELAACLASHQQRVEMLRDVIVMSGGIPAESAGPWTVFVRSIEGDAAMFGYRVAVAALEQAEDLGIAGYRAELAALDREAQSLVSDRLLPLQEQTHGRMVVLERRLVARQIGPA